MDGHINRLLDRYRRGTQQLAEALEEQQQQLAGQARLPPLLLLPELEVQAMASMLMSEAVRLLDLYELLVVVGGDSNVIHDTPPRRLHNIETTSHARLYAFRFDAVPSCWRQVYSNTQVLATFYELLWSVSNANINGGDLPDDNQQRRARAFLDVLDEVVARLDRSLVMVGGGDVVAEDDASDDGGSSSGGGFRLPLTIFGRTWIEGTMNMLQETAQQLSSSTTTTTTSSIPEDSKEFSRREPAGRPSLKRPCQRHAGWRVARFEQYMRDGYAKVKTAATTTTTTTDIKNVIMTTEIGPLPVVFTDLTAQAWPALLDRRWCSPTYLLDQTLGGRRLVPVEIGRSYVDDGWGQELMPFKEFLVRHVDRSLEDSSSNSGLGKGFYSGGGVGDDHGDNNNRDIVTETGYLAQHNLFDQIPSLRNDVLIPDFCWASVPCPDPTTTTTTGELDDDDDVSSSTPRRPKLQVPELNAWFGPPGTITPLHTDSYHNLLCQVVGTKYVRLYPPQASPLMRARPRADSNGVDMSNTSLLDVGVLEGWDEDKEDSAAVNINEDEDGNTFEKLHDPSRSNSRSNPRHEQHHHSSLDAIRRTLEPVPYFECILEPGDTLLIPCGWWHYVRSLSVSFSVSFWWN